MFKNLALPRSIKSARSNFILATALQLVEKGTGYIVLAVLTRKLLKEDLGAMFYALSIASLVAVILNFGTDTYLIRDTASHPGDSLVQLSRTLSIRFIAIVIGFVLLNIAVWFIQPA